MIEEKPIARDGRPGCPVTVWDGPYSTRCGAGARVGKCAHHGPFATTAPVSNEKPVELTEAELDALTEAGEVALPNRALVAAIVDDLVPAIIRIVEAREAATRREALLEAADELGQLRYTGGNVDFADGREFEAGRVAGWLMELAEPERDEEGGR